MFRLLALLGGLSGAASLSQFPEFSQQYMQRMAGAADELGKVVAAFDTTATTAGLTRTDALAELQGTTFLDQRRLDMTRTIARSERFDRDLAALRDRSAFDRMTQAWRFSDTELAQATWDDFKPAIPLTIEGLGFAGGGFVGGWLVLGLLFGGLRLAFRRSTVGV
jgi:hypothetical protein